MSLLPKILGTVMSLVREAANVKEEPLQMYLLGDVPSFILMQRKHQTVCSPFVIFMPAGFAWLLQLPVCQSSGSVSRHGSAFLSPGVEVML